MPPPNSPVSDNNEQSDLVLRILRNSMLQEQRIMESIEEMRQFRAGAYTEVADEAYRPQTPPATRPPAERKIDHPLDWQKLEYVDEVDDELKCSICKSPFYRPVITDECCHEFCESCLDQHLSYATTRSSRLTAPCPTCRTTLDFSAEGPVPESRTMLVSEPSSSRGWLSTLDQLHVRCPNGAALCPWTGPRSQASAHVRRHCPHTRERCVLASCDELVPRDAQAEGCLHFSVDCEFCGAAVIKADEGEHRALSCRAYKAPCELCGAPVVQEHAASHREACAVEVVDCAYTADGCAKRVAREVLARHEQKCVYGRLRGLEERMDLRVKAVENLQRENQLWLRDILAKMGVEKTFRDRVDNELRVFRTSLEERGLAPWDRSGIMAELNNRAAELQAEMQSQDMRQLSVLQHRVMPLEQAQWGFSHQISTLSAQVRQLMRATLTFGAGDVEASSSASVPAAAGNTGESSSAGGRRPSDQTDRARM